MPPHRITTRASLQTSSFPLASSHRSRSLSVAAAYQSLELFEENPIARPIMTRSDLGLLKLVLLLNRIDPVLTLNIGLEVLALTALVHNLRYFLPLLLLQRPFPWLRESLPPRFD
ncbi:hypothetical protein Rs2_23571 [Raphanus sativus]|nr:hypothetical protein Rs2_23571 [Raphanus sativus]